jgi:predicted transcriptional regulator of viral defense system
VAWLEAGPDAVVSHGSALSVYGLSELLPRRVHLTLPRTASRRHACLAVHTNHPEPREATYFSGLQVTTTQRTIGDMGRAGLGGELAVHAVEEGARKGLVSRGDLRADAGRRGGRTRRLVPRTLPAVAA